MKSLIFRVVLATSFVVTLGACGSGGGSDAAQINPRIDGNHAFNMDYIRPGDEEVNLTGNMVITQTGTGALQGNVSIVSDINQFERCFRGGQLDPDVSQVTGTSFILAWDDIIGDRITIRGSIMGRTLDGTFITEDTDGGEGGGGGNGCSARTGSFSSTF